MTQAEQIVLAKGDTIAIFGYNAQGVALGSLLLINIDDLILFWSGLQVHLWESIIKFAQDLFFLDCFNELDISALAIDAQNVDSPIFDDLRYCPR